MVGGYLWAVFTVVAAAAQTIRNATQRELTATLGTVGATHVRFLFGLPFAVIFLGGVLLAHGRGVPPLPSIYWPWIVASAVTQIGATALMLAAMGERSFVVTIAYIKTEPVQVALFGLVLLGDEVTPGMAVAIMVATAGVVVTSVKPAAGGYGLFGEIKPALLGLVSGGMFGLSAIGYRGAILSIGDPSFVMAATCTVTIGLFVQVVLLTLYLWLFDRAVLAAIFRAWRPSLFAGFMGALGSQFWLLAFAIATAASVRTLALIEVLFAQAISRFVFGQPTSPREMAGILLIVAGVALLMWSY